MIICCVIVIIIAIDIIIGRAVVIKFCAGNIDKLSVTLTLQDEAHFKFVFLKFGGL